MAGRTTLLIAHRRSTLQLAERIAVLDEGRLVDEGTHEQLIARCALYRLLLAGPGEDAEGMDAGELAYHENAGRGAPAAARGLASRPVTPSLWEAGDDAAGSGPAAGVDARQLARAPGAAIGRGFGAAARGGRGRSGAGGGMIGLAIVGADWVINVIQTNVVGRNGERMLYTLRVKIFSHLQRLGLDFYEREMSGRIMTRMTTDVDAMDTFLQTGLITMVNAVLTFVGVLAALLYINLRLGLILLTIIPVLVTGTLVFRAKSRVAYTDAREKVSIVNADLQENVAGLRTAQAYRREGRNQEHFAELSARYRRSRLRAHRLIALYFPFVQLLSTVAGALILFVAAGEVHDKTLTAGGLIAYLLYIDLLFSPVQQLSQVFDGYNQAAVTAGTLLIDGTDVRELDLAGYRQQLGVVPQEPYLFPGTVRDAIAYGRPDATDAEVEAAARGVGAIEMIARLPGGFRHEVAERGRNLAAGQRQLIALARAYLVDPAILLLDEATAALDLASEAAVNTATERLTAKRTTLVVAHRLTTAARADRIVVMESGRIAEVGTHDELLGRGGSYAALWSAFAGDAELVA